MFLSTLIIFILVEPSIVIRFKVNLHDRMYVSNREVKCRAGVFLCASQEHTIFLINDASMGEVVLLPFHPPALH